MVKKKANELEKAAKSARKHLDEVKAKREDLAADLRKRNAGLVSKIGYRGKVLADGADVDEYQAEVRRERDAVEGLEDALSSLDAKIKEAYKIWATAEANRLTAEIDQRYKSAFIEFEKAYPAIETLAEHARKVDELNKESRALFNELLPLVDHATKQKIETFRVSAIKVPFRVLLASINTYTAYQRKRAAVAKS